MARKSTSKPVAKPQKPKAGAKPGPAIGEPTAHIPDGGGSKGKKK